MSASRLALVTLLLGASAACAAPMSSTAQESQRGPTASADVQNRRSAGVHVYVLQEGHMVRLGFVEAMADESMTIPGTFVQSGGTVQLVADPLASTDWYRSEAVAVEPESRIAFTIETDLDRSSVSVTDS